MPGSLLLTPNWPSHSHPSILDGHIHFLVEDPGTYKTQTGSREVWELVIALLRTNCVTLDESPSLSGPAKKQWVVLEWSLRYLPTLIGFKATSRSNCEWPVSPCLRMNSSIIRQTQLLPKATVLLLLL